MTWFRAHWRRTLFVVLSVGDLGLTWWLLGRSGGLVYEANPVAEWFLSRYGWLGLAAFKAVMVLVVLALTEMITRQRPRVAERVLGFACAVLVLVVCHSAALARTAPTADEVVAEVNRELESFNRATQQRFAKAHAHHRLMHGLVAELLEGRATLADAVARLADSDSVADFEWLEMIVLSYPGRSLADCLASYVVHYAASCLEESPLSGPTRRIPPTSGSKA